MSESTASESGGESPEPEVLHCDFCGKTADNVRRVALDEGYERLNTKHAVQYACEACSTRKESERQSAS